MKKIVFVLICALSWMGVSAQDAVPNKEWLFNFTAIEVDGPIDLTLIQVSDDVAPKVDYSSNSVKFEAVIKNRVLYISEKKDSRRTSLTKVIVYYTTLESINIKQAKVVFEKPLESQILDVFVNYKADVTLPLEVMDLNLEASGESVVRLVGNVKYLTANIVNSTIKAYDANVVSASIDASTNAVVDLNVSERLVARTSTKAVITYVGEPTIIRGNVGFMGGEINVNKK